MNAEIQIRELRESDLPGITKLSKQLGYAVLDGNVKKQIKQIHSNPDHIAFVALSKNEVLGYIHAFRALRLTADPFLEIAGLVVTKDERGKGIGTILVKHVEGYVQKDQKIRVRCNANRKPAHVFYSNLNYREIKNQKVFEK